ncbi:SDR family NAD(P)-dependent oxidoreductase, partial [Streptomyces sp. NPDC052687]|uniref:SDR family NAD(P)-dependent oxidoreductase n=1 Tax=Streptomyces sp. NPDC052687 TaxID=3154759 RepID=UPI00343DC143
MAPSTARVTAVDTYDIRFPTSRELDCSDTMNPDPDYSAAYVVLRTDAADGHEGHGFAFTIGRDNDVQVAAIEALRAHVLGRSVDALCAGPGALSRDLVGDSQLRWLGPEKGVMHMAIGAVVNAVWDLAARRAGKPLWRLLADAEPEWPAGQIDYRYLTDALTPEDALALLRRGREGAGERRARLPARGYPAYTTSPGWLGYDDEKLTRLARRAVADGFTQIKLRVGADLDDDIRRCRTARAALPHLRRSAHAAVVNPCSIAATAGLPQRALYRATKGAVYSLTLAMAADHVREGVRVNCVNPGTVDTPWIGRLPDAAADPAAERAALAARRPTGRLVT